MRFDRVFSSTPVCSSNRSALLTGMHSTSIDAQHHRSHGNEGIYQNNEFTLPKGVRVVMDWLRPAGYTTGLMKIDLPPYYPDHPMSRNLWARYYASMQVADRKFGALMRLPSRVPNALAIGTSPTPGTMPKLP